MDAEHCQRHPDRRALALGLCASCYQMAWRRAHPRPPKAKPTGPDRFWNHVLKTETCWWWIGGVDASGYGRVRRDKVCYPAHRLAWIDTNGPVPEGLYVCHHCDRKLCVRPDHLFLGTAHDNTMDMLKKGRHGTRTHPESYPGCKTLPVRRGEENPNTTLTAEMIRAIRATRATGASQQAIADRHGIHQTTVSNIVRRVTWTHVA